jgi:ABC-type bacteriocin/lantibiotic exporter with double-glycine peptidase domain
VKDALSTIPNSVNAFLQIRVSLQRLVDFWNQPEISLYEGDEADEPRFENATITWPAEQASASAFRLRDVNLILPKNGFSLICGPLGSGKSLLVCICLVRLIPAPKSPGRSRCRDRTRVRAAQQTRLHPRQWRRK